MSEYVKKCMFCKATIQMSDKTGKWLPYNQDWSQHDCKNQSDEIDVEALLKKLNSIGVKIKT